MRSPPHQPANTGAADRRPVQAPLREHLGSAMGMVHRHQNSDLRRTHDHQRPEHSGEGGEATCVVGGRCTGLTHPTGDKERGDGRRHRRNSVESDPQHSAKNHVHCLHAEVGRGVRVAMTSGKLQPRSRCGVAGSIDPRSELRPGSGREHRRRFRPGARVTPGRPRRFAPAADTQKVRPRAPHPRAFPATCPVPAASDLSREYHCGSNAFTFTSLRRACRSAPRHRRP